MAEFWSTYAVTLAAVMAMMTLLWIVSIPLKNVSIVDPFWGLGFVVCAWAYALQLGLDAGGPRATLVLILATVWGLRLFLYLMWRNVGKGEDYRYRRFRDDFGAGYWWYSLFSVFLLQGLLMWLISAPLFGGQLSAADAPLTVLDGIAAAVWLLGFTFEAGSDWQLARFKADPANKGQLLTSGFWRFTRHPNYFGDSAVWWGFGLFAVAAGAYWTALGSVLMTALIIKVSGVALLEKDLKDSKPGYTEYARRTSAFLPWFPRKSATATE